MCLQGYILVGKPGWFVEYGTRKSETPVKTLPESNMNKQEENKEAVEVPEEASSKPDSNKNEAGISRNKTPGSLKAKSKISKKPLASKSLNIG